ncbi:RBBP9/YdeN family alpha/beta hydrolase [Actinoplanes sp. HUAS TT8]|uniref:RBBP9/YdeN family alpha/beta hydrolase n=1 Tax=Actinoplanes sp. HUAS TT8 TaxID=3447453 RepID=UPI003F5222E7
MGFLILHGWQNRRPPEHWQHWLAGQLTDLDHQVDYPQLPDPDEPDLERWLAELTTRLDGLDGPRTVIAHSLGCLLWLNGAARGLITTPVDRVLLVAPPSIAVTRSHPEIAAFAPATLIPAEVAAASRYTRLVVSDDDPYAPEGAAVEDYGKPLALDIDLLRGGAHLNHESGYGPWPAVLTWATSPDPSPPISL